MEHKQKAIRVLIEWTMWMLLGAILWLLTAGLAWLLCTWVSHIRFTGVLQHLIHNLHSP